MLQSAQTAKPRNSAKMDRPRFRRAITRPTEAHWPSSSGFQPSIQRPGRRVSGAASSTGAVLASVMTWGAMGTSGWTGGSVDADAR